jgi:Flp pilus assembly pilin Flp
MRKLVRRLIRSNDGQDLIEYGLLVGLITVGAITVITTVGERVVELFTELADAIS